MVQHNGWDVHRQLFPRLQLLASQQFLDDINFHWDHWVDLGEEYHGSRSYSTGPVIHHLFWGIHVTPPEEKLPFALLVLGLA